ncbi:hypothetical protein HNR06_003703 [Nocardiopsis arvandica]|uniref:Cytoskeleton protein RodZ-like C-terminal domain-containing protein n=1 Tax=Nocardiopsis sinuspersici TaxID=501010 RepID=A0A7Y9XE17_9ACTN|nr:helix-turn-helix domain-containing protein [Nocardiopsis sinuspersici]NYH54114.1 hypothetical protein [Nocardiopsis sinuspersici]
MATIGQTLSAARVAAGYTVADLSARTRIREPVLMGIEREDFVPCGGDFYARGHIRGICRALGLDPAPLLDEYDREHAKGAIPAFVPLQRHPAATPEGIRAAAAARAAAATREDAREAREEDARSSSPTHRFGDDDSGVGAQRWGHFERRQILGRSPEGEEDLRDVRSTRVPEPRGAGEEHRAYGDGHPVSDGHRGYDEYHAYGGHRAPDGGPVYDGGHRAPDGGPVYDDGHRAYDGGPVYDGGHTHGGGHAHGGPMNGIPVYDRSAKGVFRGGRHAGGGRARGGRPAPRPLGTGRRRLEAVRRHWPWAVVCAIVALSVLIGVRTWQDWDAGNPLRAAFDSSTGESTVGSAVDPGAAGEGTEAAPPEPAEFTVELSASARSWIEVTGADGESLYVGFLLEGEKQDYVTEENLNLWLGDAGAVSITVDGEELEPAGLPGEVKEVTVGADGLVQ